MNQCRRIQVNRNGKTKTVIVESKRPTTKRGVTSQDPPSEPPYSTERKRTGLSHRLSFDAIKTALES
jgi:hypothetical protein